MHPSQEKKMAQVNGCSANARSLVGIADRMPGGNHENTDYVLLGKVEEWGSFKPETLVIAGDQFEVTQERDEYIVRGLTLNEGAVPGEVHGKVGKWDDHQDVCIDVQTAF
jgi:hypothetical protein